MRLMMIVILLIDDQDDTIDWTTGTWFFEDVDGDGFGGVQLRFSDVRFRKVIL